jgi:chromosomal replication initiator protein
MSTQEIQRSMTLERVESLKRRYEKMHLDEGGILEVDAVILAVCLIFQVSKRDIIGGGRHRGLADARQVAMYYVRQRTKLSLKSIGLAFGGKDHATITHALSAVESKCTDKRFKTLFENVGKLLIDVS